MKQLLLLPLLFITVGVIAQPLTKATYETMIETAQEQLALRDYYNALEWYEKAYEEEKTDSVALQIGALQYQLRDYRSAERRYSRIVRDDDNFTNPEAHYRYGRLLKLNGKPVEAIPVLKQLIQFTDDETIKAKAKIELDGAVLASKLSNYNAIEVEHGGRDLNSYYSEYGPVLYRDGKTMYFGSYNRKEVIIVDGSDNDYHAKIYRSTYDEEDKEWGKPEALDSKINRPGYHTSNVAFSNDGTSMFFTRAKLSGNEVEESKIFLSVGGDGNWKGANEVVGANGDYVATQPAVGELFGKEVLFFVSNMEGGYGGYDIYYSTKESEGVYSLPVNLGPAINTVGDDVTPFYREGILYFSSTGHPGIGGYDIFQSQWDGANWSTPRNMGAGLNTSVDDRFFSVDKSGNKGFMTSNREGNRSTFGKTCCDDIFTVTIPEIVLDLVVGVFDEAKKPVKGATVQLIEMKGKRLGATDKITSEEGNRFDFGLGIEKSYAIVASKDGYFPDTVALNTVGIAKSESFEKRFYLKEQPKVVTPPTPPAPAEPVYDTITTEQPIELSNIYYDFDDDRILIDAEQDLLVIYELMTEYPDMVIELRSHTDARGREEYNRDLSQRRAESARRWLMRKDIPRSRIKATGYGESIPKTVDQDISDAYNFLNVGDVLTDSFIKTLPTEEQREAAHQLNRRTEFQILEGPTSIIIKNTRLKKRTSSSQQNTPNRNSNIQPDTVKPSDVKSKTIKISELSSLYGKKDLKGLPIMQFEKRMYHLGTVKKGDKLEFSYTFTNVGDTPLIIDLVTACTCTEAYGPDGPIAPGATGVIDVVFDSTEKEVGEIIDVDIILQNTDADDIPIIERVQYEFEIEQ